MSIRGCAEVLRLLGERITVGCWQSLVHPNLSVCTQTTTPFLQLSNFSPSDALFWA